MIEESRPVRTEDERLDYGRIGRALSSHMEALGKGASNSHLYYNVVRNKTNGFTYAEIRTYLLPVFFSRFEIPSAP